MISAAAGVAPAPDPGPTTRIGAVATPERRRLFLMVDPALILDAGLSHSGACLYAALAYMWFENVTDAKLEELERRSRRKRFDPIVVTAEELRTLTGLKKDGVAARMRELEAPHPCVWRGCGTPHPLITVRRLGQGRGLEIRRFLCGDNQPLPRKRVRLSNLPDPVKTAGDLLQRDLEGSDVDGITSTADDQNAAITPSGTTRAIAAAATTPCEKAVMPRSEDGDAQRDQNTGEPPSRTRLRPSLERASDAFKNAAMTRSLLWYPEGSQNTEATAASVPTSSSVAAAAFSENQETELTRAIEQRVLDLGRMKQPQYTEAAARRVAQRLATAALEAFGDIRTACERLYAASVDPRVEAADNPLALLIRGVVGQRRREAEADRFLLETENAAPQRRPPENLVKTSFARDGGEDPLQRLPPGLHEMLLEAIRSGTGIDGRWLRERDINPQAMELAREHVAAEAAAETSETPLCDALSAKDPVEYRARLERILDRLESPKILSAPRTLHHPMFLGMCRARLERELALERGSS